MDTTKKIPCKYHGPPVKRKKKKHLSEIYNIRSFVTISNLSQSNCFYAKSFFQNFQDWPDNCFSNPDCSLKMLKTLLSYLIVRHIILSLYDLTQDIR